MTLSTSVSVFCFLLCELTLQVVGEICADTGHQCADDQRCCGQTCCQQHYSGYGGYRLDLWNMWYFWFIVIFILMSCFGGCGYWRRRQLMLHQHQAMLQHQQAYNYLCQATMGLPPPLGTVGAGRGADGGVAGSGSTQPEGSFPAPPPYSEVVSKPHTYPPNKDELPPYPGDFSHNYNGYVATNNLGASNDDGSVPGLPPYSMYSPPVPTAHATPPAAAAAAAAATADPPASPVPASSATSPPYQPHATGQTVAPPRGQAENYVSLTSSNDVLVGESRTGSPSTPALTS